MTHRPKTPSAISPSTTPIITYYQATSHRVHHDEYLQLSTMRLLFPTTLMGLATTNRRVLLRSSSTIAKEYDEIKPFYRLYYNDVYEVKLPPRHRFPMNKYAQVRRKVQQMISELDVEQQNMVDCGTYLYYSFCEVHL